MSAKKILGAVLVVASIALIATGVGAPLGLGTIGVALGGAFISDAVLLGIGLGLAGSFLLGPSLPKGLSTGAMQTSRLTATLVPTEPRKSWLGHTAGETDVRYQAFTGSNQEYLEMIVVHASHAAHSIDELWLDNELAWTSGGGAQGRFAGYLTVDTRPEGNSGNGIAINSTWTSSCTLTGCAYSHLKCKLTGNSDKVSSPFSSGVTSRMTFRGKGAKVYDPRLDSTVAGGSGGHRADDQTTWAWDDNGSRNPALQELFYELGWKIGGKLAVGKGVPPARIDLASYAVAANACDESVALNGGGTEPRYRSDGIVSEGDDPPAVRENLCATMNAVLRDAGGKLALDIIHNDLATPKTPWGKAAFDEDDVIGDIQWNQTPDINQSFNVVRGRRIDPSDNALYQATDFPEISIASIDGIDRISSVDYPFVQSNGQAQRLAKQRLQRNQYQGQLTLTGKPSFWGLNIGDVFPFSSLAFGWTGKLFRCAAQKISRTGETQIVAVEENVAIYAWDNDEAPGVTAGTPTVYDPLMHPIVQGIGDAFARSIEDPPQRLSFRYDYTGTAESGEFSRDLTFKLDDSSGQITSGIVWAYLVQAGTVNGFTNASGSQAMAGAGTGTLTVSSLGSSAATVQVSATFAGKTYVKTIALSKDVAAPPVSGGGGGGSTIATKTGGFSPMSSSTFADLTGAITGSLGGPTSALVNVNLDCTPPDGTPDQNWSIELKVMRDISGTPTQIGTTQSAGSSTTSDLGGGVGYGVAASFGFSIADSGLGSSETWRVYGRVISAGFGIVTHSVTGSVTVTT